MVQIEIGKTAKLQSNIQLRTTIKMNKDVVECIYQCDFVLSNIGYQNI